MLDLEQRTVFVVIRSVGMYAYEVTKPVRVFTERATAECYAARCELRTNRLRRIDKARLNYPTERVARLRFLQASPGRRGSIARNALDPETIGTFADEMITYEVFEVPYERETPNA